MNDAMTLAPETESAIPFARGFVKSDAFMVLFREGMGLVERTASYLDGEGRADSAALPRELSLTYATESMRLTTRLMQIASWLLVQRAVAEGEMTAEQARDENGKVRLNDPAPALELSVAAQLPVSLLELMTHAQRLQKRIVHLEARMHAPVDSGRDNPVLKQLDVLRARFAPVI